MPYNDTRQIPLKGTIMDKPEQTNKIAAFFVEKKPAIVRGAIIVGSVVAGIIITSVVLSVVDSNSDDSLALEEATA